MNYEYLLLLSNFMASHNFLKQVSHLDIDAHNWLPFRSVKICFETFKRESGSEVQSREGVVMSPLPEDLHLGSSTAKQKLFAYLKETTQT